MAKITPQAGPAQSQTVNYFDTAEAEELRQLISETVASNAKGIAEAIGSRYFTLKAGLNSRFAPRFSAFRLLALIRATGDLRTLEWFASKIGHALFPVPQARPIKGDLLLAGFRVQDAYHQMAHAWKDCFTSDHNVKNFCHLSAAASKLIAAAAEIQATAHKLKESNGGSKQE
jgi:hypothetical protein